MGKEQTDSGWGIRLFFFYGGQFRIAAVCRYPFSAVLKEPSDLHVLMTVGRAFHILVA